ncbi:MAG: hypothetical protein ACR2H3_06620 [Acidimicrobiales bacterium]
MAVDETLLNELRTVKTEIDALQDRLKAIVEQLREKGASAQEIAAALRGEA